MLEETKPPDSKLEVKDLVKDITTKSNLANIIENATKESLKASIQDPSKPPEEPTKEPDKEPTSEPNKEPTTDEPEKEPDLKEEEVAFAKNLYKALNNPDPNIQLKALRMLANAANMDLKEIETKKDIKEAEKDLVALLKEGLGEFDFLAEKLGPVLEKALKSYVAKETEPLKLAQQAAKEEKLRDEVSSAVDKAFSEYTNATEVKDEVIKLMDNFKPSAKMAHKDYFRSLIILAASNKGVTLKLANSQVTQDTNAKIDKNRRDAATRLASERVNEVKDVTRVTQFKNLKEAVADAAEKALTLSKS